LGIGPHSGYVYIANVAWMHKSLSHSAGTDTIRTEILCTYCSLVLLVSGTLNFKVLYSEGVFIDTTLYCSMYRKSVKLLLVD